jgi:hypothetical protein
LGVGVLALVVGHRGVEDLADVHRRFHGLGAADVLHERRDGDGGEDSNDGDDDHQLDQGEALANSLEHGPSFNVVQHCATTVIDVHYASTPPWC